MCDRRLTPLLLSECVFESAQWQSHSKDVSNGVHASRNLRRAFAARILQCPDLMTERLENGLARSDLLWSDLTMRIWSRRNLFGLTVSAGAVKFARANFLKEII